MELLIPAFLAGVLTILAPCTLPLLPIIIFVPIIEMAQRTLVTLDKHTMVMSITLACMTTAVLCFGVAAIVWNNPLSVMLAITISLGVGVLPDYIMSAVPLYDDSAHQIGVLGAFQEYEIPVRIRIFDWGIQFYSELVRKSHKTAGIPTPEIPEGK